MDPVDGKRCFGVVQVRPLEWFPPVPSPSAPLISLGGFSMSQLGHRERKGEGQPEIRSNRMCEGEGVLEGTLVQVGFKGTPKTMPTIFGGPLF